MNAGSNIVSGSNNICIGYGVLASSAASSNTLNIGNWIYGNNGKIGLCTATNTTVSLQIGATDAMIIPTGTTAQRPAAPSLGMVRINSNVNKFEYYNGSAWLQL